MPYVSMSRSPVWKSTKPLNAYSCHRLAFDFDDELNALEYRCIRSVSGHLGGPSALNVDANGCFSALFNPASSLPIIFSPNRR
jgi:hypothetical protein